VQAASGSLGIQGQYGLDTVTLGSTGSVQQINENVTVGNTFGRTALVINDSANATARSAELWPTFLRGLHADPWRNINWEPTQLRSLTILGGSGGNTINIVGTPAAAGLQEPTFYTGDGPDNVHVLAANGPFTLNTGAGNDTVELASQANTLAGIQSDLTVTG